MIGKSVYKKMGSMGSPNKAKSNSLPKSPPKKSPPKSSPKSSPIKNPQVFSSSKSINAYEK
jgi:hypothetical protein